MTTNQELWDAVVAHLSLDEGYTIGVSPGQLCLSRAGRWTYVRNPGDITTWSVETYVAVDGEAIKHIRVVADADRAVQAARDFMTGASDRAPFQVEPVWNREFHFVRRGDPFDTLNAARDYAMTMANLGDGENVKKVRVIDADYKVVWSYG